jgi:hypothetical protein
LEREIDFASGADLGAAFSTKVSLKIADLAPSNRVEYRLHMKSLIFRKLQRAKSVVLDGQHLFLKECAKCESDFYGTEKRTRCDECMGKRRRCAS